MTLHLTEAEANKLFLLCGQAFQLRSTGYLTDAAAAIEDWFDQLYLRRLELEEEKNARAIRVIRETRLAALAVQVPKPRAAREAA